MSHIEIKLARPRVDEVFARYKHLIGKDFPGYRNYVYRTITYAMHFLDNEPEYEALIETICAYFAYHDIGLWTDHTLAYLEPSEAVALADNEKYDWGFDPQLFRNAIHWHQKITPYSGKSKEVIEACQKADWVDISKDHIRKGMSKAVIRKVEAAFSNLGFQNTLLRLTKDYEG